MRKIIVIAVLAGGLTGCGRPTDDNANRSAPAAAPAANKAAYCFFKDEEMKGWSAKRGADGNIVVKGKVYREDSRYQAVLNPAVVTGARAEVSPNLQQNSGSFGAPANWWDVSETISASAGVDTVDVTCGGKVVAEFKLKPKR
jgi:hypothetical protein